MTRILQAYTTLYTCDVLPPCTRCPMNPACHIIIADDEDNMRALLVRIVERTYPLAIITAVTDGVTARRVYQQRGADLLITDHAMPHGNGLELVQVLRAQA